MQRTVILIEEGWCSRHCGRAVVVFVFGMHSEDRFKSLNLIVVRFMSGLATVLIFITYSYQVDLCCNKTGRWAIELSVAVTGLYFIHCIFWSNL